MSTIARLKLFPKDVVSLRRCIYTNRPNSDAEKAFQKFKVKQARMQCDDNLPVYLKCGMRDKLCLWITVGFTALNFLLNMKKLKALCDKFGCIP